MTAVFALVALAAAGPDQSRPHPAPMTTRQVPGSTPRRALRLGREEH